MDWKRIAVLFVLADFSTLTAYAVAQHGLVGIFQLAFANTATITLAVDLLIALSLITVWMWQDARDRGVTPIPYLLLTMTLGSVGPLLYLARHGHARV
jgi:hypothetical protein